MKGICHPDDYDGVLEMIRNSSTPDVPLETDEDCRRGVVYFVPTKSVRHYAWPPV